VLLRPSWRVAGAAGYLWFDIAALWAMFNAIGSAPPLAALVLGYLIGYLANGLPVPGGIGVLDAGLAGALYGVPARRCRRGRARLPRRRAVGAGRRRAPRVRGRAAPDGPDPLMRDSLRRCAGYLLRPVGG
jgi:hypothetical protein